MAGRRAAGPDGSRRRTAGTWHAANTAMVKGVHAVELAPGDKWLSPNVAALPGRPGSRDAGSADLRGVRLGAGHDAGRPDPGVLCVREAGGWGSFGTSSARGLPSGHSR